MLSFQRTDLTEKVKPSMRRKNATKLREVKQGIRKFEKLVNAVSEFRTAVEMVISQVPNIQGAILVLGPNPIRPQHVYELHFSHGKCISEGPPDFSKSKAAEALSRKVPSLLLLLPPYLAILFSVICEISSTFYSTGYSSTDLRWCWFRLLPR